MRLKYRVFTIDPLKTLDDITDSRVQANELAESWRKTYNEPNMKIYMQEIYEL